MVCIYCGGPTHVTNSRSQKRSNATWRRRACTKCSAVCTTIEVIDLSTAIIVTGPKPPCPFSRDKLFVSIYDSCKHRKDAQASATSLTDTIIKHLYPLIDNASVSSSTIRDVTLKTLGRFDTVAGVHYGAYHPSDA